MSGFLETVRPFLEKGYDLTLSMEDIIIDGAYLGKSITCTVYDFKPLSSAELQERIDEVKEILEKLGFELYYVERGCYEFFLKEKRGEVIL